MSVWFWAWLATVVFSWLAIDTLERARRDAMRGWEEAMDSWRATIDELADAELRVEILQRCIRDMEAQRATEGEGWKS